MISTTLRLLVLLFCLILAPTAVATDIHVDDNAPGDPGPGDTAVSDPLEDGTTAHPYDAIQEAINAAALTSDNILVADGTYSGIGNRDMDFGGRRITVRSVNGYGACTISPQGTASNHRRAFIFQHGENRYAVVQGFTIYGGYAFDDVNDIGGGGILITNGAPTITGNYFDSNSCYLGSGDNWYGGAIHCSGGTTPLISGNTFTGNHAEYGGAINCTESSAEITGNSFSANIASRGSAIHCISDTPWIHNPVITHNTITGHTGVGTGASTVWLSFVDGVVSGNEFTNNDVLCLRLRVGDPIVEQNTFSNNTDGCIHTGPNGAPYIHQNSFIGNSTTSGGTGIYVDSYQDVAIVDNYFFDNHADDDGGAIRLYTYDECVPLILGNVIVGNSALEDGGGISNANNAEPIIAGNIISGNQAGDRGGAIYTATNQWQIQNNLITGNSAGEGGGIYVYNSPYHLGTGIVSGNTLVNNTAVAGGGIYLLVEDLNDTSITDSIVWGNTPDQITVQGIAPGVSYCCIQGGATGPGNFDSDPLFVTGPDSDYYLSNFLTGHGANSPCTNRGSDVASALLVPVGYDTATGTIVEAPLTDLTCRVDHAGDTGQADMGFHHPRTSLVSAEMICLPESGTVPFDIAYTATIRNHRTQSRQIAGRIDARLGGGLFFSYWRAGYTVIAGNSSYEASWVVNTPAYPTVLGNNLFTLYVEDVTPAPYNQPPWSGSGDTGADSCEVTAIAP